MTLPRKANHVSHLYPRTGASAPRRAPVEGSLYGNFAVVVNTNYGNRMFAAQTEARRCAGVFQVQSRVLRGGVAWWNQDRISAAGGQERTSEQLFIPGAKIFRGSDLSSGRSGPTTRSQVSPCERSARSATRAFSSTASASPTPKRCMRSTARSSATNSSSGDGLGIQQPGSMTRGFASRRQPPSGRARDRATCPAVARFIERRAAC